MYAMAGAAGVVAGITHTISPCVVIIEITAQANNSLPLLVVTVVSYVVSGGWVAVEGDDCVCPAYHALQHISNQSVMRVAEVSPCF